ncbi:50S ribosomal protein L6 [Phaeodactylibacter luteus]|uniref:Large ribosomal subunit protein uL6 n=1 Tax=Phaeodactylibacter luteus TaxID=1564516 RepID=A0A5C6RHR5_9BACT|nr:50S ribosomal protein L6 [Phaeodactylibacter luteus]TXB61946.1 50S ribosomal protein L6 [Phaeodactylibacter luteus]
MSRIGKAPISVPSGVSIDISKGNLVTVKGPKGELTQQVDPDLSISLEDGTLTISRPTEQKRHRAMHGLYRALLSNMVTGVTEGFVKELQLVGVGYRCSNTGQLLELSVGYSHPIMFALPDEVKVTTAMEKGKDPSIRLESHDKQLLGEVANKIRSYRKPEPYKGKGIRFAGEYIRRKAGKSAGK